MEFTHINEEGRAKMVDVSEKIDTVREAVAVGSISMKRETLERIKDGSISKGDVLAVAQVGGIMGAKSTSQIIPMCHPIMISGCNISFKNDFENNKIEIKATTKTVGKTGIEMEALTAVSVAALTIYDMCKAIDRGMVINNIMLVKKSGGKSGIFEKEGAVMAKVIAVNISEKKGVIKHPIKKGFFKFNHGLDGDAHAGNWHRQVSLLGVESIDKMKDKGATDLSAGNFAENITTEGIVLYELPVGTKLKIGEVVLEVTQIGKECHTGCAIKKLVGDCIMPREGIFAKVIEEGYIKPGDDIVVEE